MDVKLEEIEAQLGNRGVLLRISSPNGGGSIGRLRVGKAKLRWYKGKTSKNYKEVSIEKFVDWLDSQ
jgi:hypothetical protein